MSRFFLILCLFIVLLSGSFCVQGEEVPLVNTIFDNTFILDALRDLSLQTGVPIIADESLSGFVNVDIMEMPLEKALELILASGGYTYVQKDGYYLVGVPDPGSASFRNMARIEYIELKHIHPREAKELLPEFFHPFLSYSQDSSILTIMATEEIIDICREHVEILDTAPDQLMVQVLLTEVSRWALEELGAEELQLAWRGRQVEKEDWQTFFRHDLGTITLQGELFMELLSRLRILEQENEAHIQANPWVVVAEGETMEFFVGERQLLILHPSETSRRVEQVDVGVHLNLTAHVLDEETIRIEVSPEISHLKEKGQDQMLVHKSQLSTTVYVQPGQTMVLSGITLQEERQSWERIPLLGQIPLLRWLFGMWKEGEGERELFMFITTEIL